MSDTVDPYRQWLGISDPQRPLDHYVLLGLDPYESDRDKIWDLAMGQMGRVLAVDPNLQNAEARRVFDELEAARDCLCHPLKKQDYDLRLRERRQASPPVQTAGAVPPADPSPVAAVAPEHPAVAEAPVTAEPPASALPVETRPEPAPQQPFDPYRQWLGITDPHRPPNHYVLLGLKLYEDDRERIDDVSMLLMAQALEHDPGPHCQEARRIFDELEAARNCLCDSQKKQAYDALLRGPHTGKAASARAEVSPAANSRKKSWSSLVPRGSSVLHGEDDSHSGSLAVATESDSSIGRRAETPKPAEPTETPAARDLRQNRLVGVVLGTLGVAAMVLYFLWREPPEHNPVPALIAQLGHRDPQQRLEAARALKKLGPRSSDALPQLVQALGSEAHDDVRFAVAQAVREAGPGTVLYSRDFEVIKMQEMHPGVLQILNELTSK